jgi:hypothetical protein
MVSLVSSSSGILMALMMTVFRIVSCPYVSSLMLLVVNNLRDLQHPRMQLDGQLVDTALQWLTNYAKEVQREDICVVRDVCAEIVRVLQQKRVVASTMGRGNGLLPSLIFE